MILKRHYDDWRAWFAWYPVRLEEGWVWFEWVERRVERKTSYVEWTYRPFGSRR